MKHLYLFFLISIFTFPSVTLAQGNYKPGYVVNFKGDTLKGYIGFKDWIKNPNEFNFKTNKSDNLTVYSVDNCSAFGISGIDHYRRYRTSISQDNIQVSELTTGPNKDTLLTTAFFKIVASGKYLTMYTYEDRIKNRFFVAENNANVVELIRRLYLDPENQLRIITQNTYMGQLQHLAAKYQPQDEKLILNIARTAYNGDDIKRVVDKINGSTVQPALQLSKQSGARLFVGAALNNNLSNFHGYHLSKSSSSYYPQVSFGTDIFINKNTGYSLVKFELGFTGAKVNILYNEELANSSTESVLKYDHVSGFFNAQFLYNFFNTNSIRIYAGIGGQINYAAYSNKSYITTYTLSDGLAKDTENDFPTIKSFYANITSRLGVVINNKLDIYTEYNPYTEITDNASYTLNEASFKLGVNYLFGKK